MPRYRCWRSLDVFHLSCCFSQIRYSKIERNERSLNLFQYIEDNVWWCADRKKVNKNWKKTFSPNKNKSLILSFSWWPVPKKSVTDFHFWSYSGHSAHNPFDEFVGSCVSSWFSLQTTFLSKWSDSYQFHSWMLAVSRFLLLRRSHGKEGATAVSLTSIWSIC